MRKHNVRQFVCEHCRQRGLVGKRIDQSPAHDDGVADRKAFQWSRQQDAATHFGLNRKVVRDNEVVDNSVENLAQWGFRRNEAGLLQPLDGLDLSPIMLELARATGCYRHLERANLLLPDECPALGKPYDFAITMGLMGDYVPYYIALPHIVSSVREGGHAGYAVEQRSTPRHALEKLALQLGLVPLSETILPVPEGKLAAQTYTFFVARLSRSSTN